MRWLSRILSVVARFCDADGDRLLAPQTGPDNWLQRASLTGLLRQSSRDRTNGSLTTSISTSPVSPTSTMSVPYDSRNLDASSAPSRSGRSRLRRTHSGRASPAHARAAHPSASPVLHVRAGGAVEPGCRRHRALHRRQVFATASVIRGWRLKRSSSPGQPLLAAGPAARGCRTLVPAAAGRHVGA